ncbi:MAG: hypothetical protein ABR521_12720 [Gaiellaceae bacterium]
MLQIKRHGSTVFDKSVSGIGALVLDLSVLPLDGGEPAVVIDLNIGGGNHCCGGVAVYWYRSGQYVRTTAEIGCGANPPKRRQLDRRQAVEFTGCVFLGFFGQSPSQGWPPIRIWHFRHGRFAVVTRRYPSAVAADAQRAWRFGPEPGALAGWIADQYLLGDGRHSFVLVEPPQFRSQASRLSRHGFVPVCASA